MGSSNSKTGRVGGTMSSSSPSVSSVAGIGRRRSKDRIFFRPSCLGSSSRSVDSDDEDRVSYHHTNDCATLRYDTPICQTESKSNKVKLEYYQALKVDQPDDMPGISSNDELGEWGSASDADNDTGTGGISSRASFTRSLNHCTQFLSRFSFVPGGVSFGLRRATSVGSSSAYHASPRQLSSSSAGPDNVDSSRSLSINQPDDEIISRQDPVRNDDMFVYQPSPRTLNETEGINRRFVDRGNGTRGSADRNVRFSRTLSVGRLRDRVLRRSSFSELTLSPLEQESMGTSDGNAVASRDSSAYSPSSTLYSSQNYESEMSQLRDARYRDLLEHGSSFLERRRRSQALQRLGSRVENLSGHERHCILSGQHRTGRCTCRLSNRDSNSNENSGTRANISRIVMLAEALFEVLDEIHLQSVALSSRPSVSSIESVPAPNEVVDSLPVKMYSKSAKFQTEEIAQCYICLVEYEEGDDVRILPCHHEFHRACIDKWLKEIHRVCPLCRGNICTSSFPSIES